MISILIAKVLGAIYRIPLTNILGAEGIGCYQLVFPVYAFAVTLTSGAYPVAIAKLLNECEDGGMRRSVYTALVHWARLTGLAGTVTLVVASGLLATLQGRDELAVSYCILAPAVTISAEIAVVKGWYQSELNMMPSALSAIVEQTAKVAMGLTAVYLLRDRPVAYQVMAAVGAVTVSEAVTLIVLRVYGRGRGAKVFSTMEENKKMQYGYAKSLLFNTVFPLTASTIVTPLTNLVDSLMLIDLLTLYGVDNIEATAMYGVYCGAALTIINLPIVLTIAFSAYVVPFIAEQNRRRNVASVRDEASFVIKSACFLCVPIAALIGIFAEDYLPILYPSFDVVHLSLAVRMIRFSAVTIPLCVLLQIYSGILNALSGEKDVLINTIFCAVVKLTFTISLTLIYGIMGVVYASVIGALLSLVGIRIKIDKFLGRERGVDRSIGLTVVCGAIAAACGVLYDGYVPSGVMSFVLGGIFVAALYLLLVLICRVFDQKELTSLLDIVKIKSRKTAVE